MSESEVERMADPLDHAAWLSDQTVNAGVTEIRRAAAPAQTKVLKVVDGVETWVWPITECVDCDDPIPEARLNHGYETCVFCAERRERRKNGFL